jgi:phosphoesterase RecJ-like protein
MIGLPELKALLDHPKNIVLTSHRNPDGDALGASQALAYLLRKKGHQAVVIYPSEFPAVFSFLPEINQAMIWDEDPEPCVQKLKQADIIFCLDYNSLERVDKMGIEINDTKAKIVLIDHHIDPEPFSDFELSDTTASSTSELIYDFIKMLEYDKFMDEAFATSLYTGIITDTGSFKFSTSAKLFRIVAELKELGVDDKALQDKIYNSLSEKYIRLLGHCLHNRMEIMNDLQAGIIVLNRSDYQVFDIQRGDTEGIVNYLLMMKQVKIAAFITQQPNIIKISLRSKGDISVQTLARDHFNGGGHKNASGGYMHASLSSVIKKFKEVLPNYI